MSIKIIACVDENYGLGYKQDLLFHIPEDLKMFKEKTSGHFCVMGRKTYESLPSTLPNRTNVIITRNKNYSVDDYHVIIEHDIHKIINHYLESGSQSKDIYVIGGERIFKEFFPYVDTVELTMVRTKADKCDCYFPYEYLNDFEIIHKQTNYISKYKCEYDFITYVRKEGANG